MIEVKSSHLMVAVAGLDETFQVGNGNNAGSWRMRVREATVWYEWDRLVGHWRVTQTVVSGDPKTRECPDTHCFAWGDHTKPLWVVALEHRFYPKEGFRNG